MAPVLCYAGIHNVQAVLSRSTLNQKLTPLFETEYFRSMWVSRKERIRRFTYILVNAVNDRASAPLANSSLISFWISAPAQQLSMRYIKYSQIAVSGSVTDLLLTYFLSILREAGYTCHRPPDSIR